MAHDLELCSKTKSSSFWTNYSMLKSTLAVRCGNFQIFETELKDKGFFYRIVCLFIVLGYFNIWYFWNL